MFTGGGGGGGGGSPISNNDALIVCVFFGGLPRGRFDGDSGDDDNGDDAVLFLDGEGLFFDEEGNDLEGLPLFLGVFLAGDGMVVCCVLFLWM